VDTIDFPEESNDSSPITGAIEEGAGLRPLAVAVVPEGTREIRIWKSSSPSEPNSLYRLVDTRGHVTGQLFHHWYVIRSDKGQVEDRHPSEHEMMLSEHVGRCEQFRVVAGAGVCRVLFTSPPDWHGVLREIEAAGVWTLADPDSLAADNVEVPNGWGMRVELLDHDRYRTYGYYMPESHPTWTDGPKAVEIARLVSSVDSLIRPHVELPQYTKAIRAAP
jgi:hypothetical protein